jgi:hypothetical protein
LLSSSGIASGYLTTLLFGTHPRAETVEESVWDPPRGGSDDSMACYLVEGCTRWGIYNAKPVHLVQRSSTRCSFFCPRKGCLVDCSESRMGIVGQATAHRLAL